MKGMSFLEPIYNIPLSWKKLFGGGDEGDTYGKNQLFASLVVDLKEKGAKRVEAEGDIESHYLNHTDFSCLINFSLEDNRRVELEFPVKHFNLHPVSKAFQVETGPILFIKPGFLSTDNLDLLSGLIPSFIHFNSFSFADVSLDFPYGVKEPSRRGKMMIEEVKCDIQLWVANSPDV